jgi:hypothetical protein
MIVRSGNSRARLFISAAALGEEFTAGKALPVGTYRWELDGQAKDGDGALISPGGKTTLTATVKITAIT